MPGRAFLPSPLGQAQPRVYRSFRGRQLKGLLLSAAGAALGLLLFGARNPTAYGATFLLAIPGFAYGYFQPDGKPVEYWLQVQWRYAVASRSWIARPLQAALPGRKSGLGHLLRVAIRARRMRRMHHLKEGA